MHSGHTIQANLALGRPADTTCSKEKLDCLALAMQDSPSSKKQPFDSCFINDGFDWRKYGQKTGKGGSNSVTCYYRCAATNCPVKRMLSRRADGMVVSVYRGRHTHHKPAITTLEISSQTELARAARQETCLNNDMDLTEERQVDTLKGPMLIKYEPGDHTEAGASSMPPAVCKTICVLAHGVEPSDDGLQWRKYGQKVVQKNTEHPMQRSYYRCVCTHSGDADCPVKKIVETNQETGVVTIEYTNRHNHSFDSIAKVETGFPASTVPTAQPVPFNRPAPVQQLVIPHREGPDSALGIPMDDMNAVAPPIAKAVSFFGGMGSSEYTEAAPPLVQVPGMRRVDPATISTIPDIAEFADVSI
ncbi:WRKY transcription factor [Carpediemonas membranifera]|uniref:WRKY transcription factor n=1 Tax=Carpediemonas membranifera TaxID=201153 RepID=A0A8J6EA08_9EUKA|nr:WRKY transcription factor [Carpediemonas membranifera]|eukprot:KAG9394075.1 WRKY transcription factor [Carpediemonas membranifera]